MSTTPGDVAAHCPHSCGQVIMLTRSIQADVARYSSADVFWFRKKILSWAKRNGRTFPWRRKSAGCYEKVVSEVLLQRTRAEVIATYFPKFVRQFPSWKKLSLATEKELQEYLQPIGLWRRRAASIKKLSMEMSRRRGRFPRDKIAVEALPGVGQYIANAIMVFCYNEPWPLLDTNMARVIERFFGPRKLADIRYDPYLQSLAKSAVSTREPALGNWAILDFASLVCTLKNPRHDICPIIRKCQYFTQLSSK
jgi:A/G-specific adenine glycosylase